jgi:shikimate kinase
MTASPEGRPIVLIGFMATGKTTVGQLVAERLGRRFVDLDRLIEETAGTTVAELFASGGEPGFRRVEAQALRQALATPHAVVATGGGAACREDNLQAMLDQGLVVALSATPVEVLRRTGASSGRPLLDAADDPLAVATRLLGEREPFYARAHLRVDTVGRTPAQVAALVVDLARQREGT